MSYELTFNDLRGMVPENTLHDIKDYIVSLNDMDDDSVFPHRDLLDMIPDNKKTLMTVLNVCHFNDEQEKEFSETIHRCLLNSINIFELNFRNTTFNVRKYLESAVTGDFTDKNNVYAECMKWLPNTAISESLYFLQALAVVTDPNTVRIDLGVVLDLLFKANIIWYRKSFEFDGSVCDDITINLVENQILAYHNQLLERMLAYWSYSVGVE